jgi:hypothetical protein
MSLVLGLLMRHVIVTPIPKEIDLVQTMRDLRFQEVMNTLGIFYMDISLTNLYCTEIPTKDSQLLVHKFQNTFLEHPKSSTKREPPRLQLVRSQLSQQYPWGDTLGIKQLQELIDTCPSQFLRPPTFLTEEDMRHPDSAVIFRLFSMHIWLLASEYFHGKPADFDLPNLTAAMEVWTIKGLQERCHHISLKPTFDGIEVEGKLPQTSFLSRRPDFFPGEDEIRTHPCAAFLNVETTYLSIYHHALRQQGGDSINKDLDRILSLLQCLPASHSNRGRTVIWKLGNESCLQFVVNASLYRVKRVTTRSEISQPKYPRPQVTQAMLLKNLNFRR